MEEGDDDDEESEDADADDADGVDDDEWRPRLCDIVRLGGSGHILSGQVLGVDGQLLILGADLRLVSC